MWSDRLHTERMNFTAHHLMNDGTIDPGCLFTEITWFTNHSHNERDREKFSDVNNIDKCDWQLWWWWLLWEQKERQLLPNRGINNSMAQRCSHYARSTFSSDCHQIQTKHWDGLPVLGGDFLFFLQIWIFICTKFVARYIESMRNTNDEGHTH